MSDEKTKEEIMRLLGIQHVNQSIEKDPVQVIAELLLNQTNLKTKKTNLIDGFSQANVISEVKQRTFLNEDGSLEESEDQDFYILDDGTSLTGVTICQTCGGRVKEESIRRCECGKICCVRPGCARRNKNDENWYCSGWHAFLGFLGFNLR